MKRQQYRAIALPGEGVGLEVVPAAIAILERVAEIHNFNVAIEYGLIGNPAYKKYGNYFPEVTQNFCREADGIVFGAVSQGGLLEVRKAFNFFANLRPIKIFPALIDKSSLKPEIVSTVDILFVRELVSGIYFGKAERNGDREYGYHTMFYYDREIRQIARVALKKASQRRKLLTVAHKENALPHLHWTELVMEEAVNFPDVMVEGMLVDNLAMQLVLNPQHFDVILAGNLFGDILSDLGGALVGSLGLLGSASLNKQGFGMYEPIHGTAPAIAGKGIANPLGAIASVVMMLEQWGEIEAAKSIVQSTETILNLGYRTADLHPQGKEILVNTEELTELLLKELS